jgi:hypothetical protein
LRPLFPSCKQWKRVWKSSSRALSRCEEGRAYVGEETRACLAPSPEAEQLWGRGATLYLVLEAGSHQAN